MLNEPASSNPKELPPVQTNTVQVTVGELAFEFESHTDWVCKGPAIWRKHDIDNGRGICIDAKGRICEMGAHFDRATKTGAYPIKVYRKQPA